MEIGLFGQPFWEEVVAIAVALWVYDWVLDPAADKLLKRLKRSFLERQGIS